MSKPKVRKSPAPRAASTGDVSPLMIAVGLLRSGAAGLSLLFLALLAGAAFTLASWVLTPRTALAEGAGAAGSRGKVIDFEDALVEGVNKKPYDSLSSLSERSRRKKAHLYQKRPSFAAEQDESSRETRWIQ
ncbi:MAG: hypothetical protein IT285_11845 [Bdellovibrionales bacterium]|nr:hypothetical protein [Bdellovibrionales bacterium]